MHEMRKNGKDERQAQPHTTRTTKTQKSRTYSTPGTHTNKRRTGDRKNPNTNPAPTTGNANITTNPSGGRKEHEEIQTNKKYTNDRTANE